MKNSKKVEVLKSEQRGYADHGWLKSFHSFSFANYYNPDQIGFSDLRVINDDLIAPGRGFGTHPHRDMEIFTYVTKGKLAHKDSMGNVEEIKAGEVQLMSAGSGVAHSEFNPSQDTETHLFQIWILPETKGGIPGYQQKEFQSEEKRGNLRLIVSPDETNNSLKIKQDVKVYAGLFNGNESFSLKTKTDRSYYVHVVSGNINVDGVTLKEGDAIKIYNIDEDLIFKNGLDSEVLVFDLMKH